MKELEELKIQGEKDKLQDGEAIEDVQKWGVDIEGEIDETDCEISHLNQYLTEAEARTENEKREKEKILLKQQRDEEVNHKEPVKWGTRWRSSLSLAGELCRQEFSPI